MRKEHLIPFEKSKRVIYLDKRGKDVGRKPVASVIFGVLGVLCLIYCLAIFFFMGYGTKFFLIWGVLAAACGVLAVVLKRCEWLERIPKWIRDSGRRNT